jgi:HSP20 family protein
MNLKLVCHIILVSFIATNIAISAESKTKKDNLKNKTNEDFMSQEYDEFLNPKWIDIFENKLTTNYPRLNIQELSDAYKIEIELPGIKKEDVNLKLKDDYLIISGDKYVMKEEEKSKYRRIERRSGSFYRAVSVPRDADKENVSAKLENGILTIHLNRLKGQLPTTEKTIVIK